jgi:hypothetical protein
MIPPFCAAPALTLQLFNETVKCIENMLDVQLVRQRLLLARE